MQVTNDSVSFNRDHGIELRTVKFCIGCNGRTFRLGRVKSDFFIGVIMTGSYLQKQK